MGESGFTSEWLRTLRAVVRWLRYGSNHGEDSSDFRVTISRSADTERVRQSRGIRDRVWSAALRRGPADIREKVPRMKAIVVTDPAAGTAGMTLVDRPEPAAAINDVVVQVHASGWVSTELEWPSTWTDRASRDRTPSIPGHEMAGVVAALGYGTTGLLVGQRVFGLADWHRDGTLAEYVAIEARNLAPLPDDVDFTVGASLPISGLTAWQGLFQHGRHRTRRRPREGARLRRPGLRRPRQRLAARHRRSRLGL